MDLLRRVRSSHDGVVNFRSAPLHDTCSLVVMLRPAPRSGCHRGHGETNHRRGHWEFSYAGPALLLLQRLPSAPQTVWELPRNIPQSAILDLA